jgi:transcriptional regulator with XRE-family HTH domain
MSVHSNSFYYSSQTKNFQSTRHGKVGRMIRRLGTKVRRLRERAGLSQADLAQAIGLSEQSKGFISEIESSKKIPKAELILRLALHFSVSTDYLLRDDMGLEDTEEA